MSLALTLKAKLPRSCLELVSSGSPDRDVALDGFFQHDGWHRQRPVGAGATRAGATFRTPRFVHCANRCRSPARDALLPGLFGVRHGPAIVGLAHRPARTGSAERLPFFATAFTLVKRTRWITWSRAPRSHMACLPRAAPSGWVRGAHSYRSAGIQFVDKWSTSR